MIMYGVLCLKTRSYLNSYVAQGHPQGNGSNAKGPPQDLFHSHNGWFWPHNDSSVYGQLYEHLRNFCHSNHSHSWCHAILG